jgi:hypothetical protein
MADTEKWPLSARPMNMSGTGGAKSKGKRRVMISAEAKAPPLIDRATSLRITRIRRRVKN